MRGNIIYPSLRFLQDRIKALFHEKRLSPAFPGSGCDLIWPSDAVVDVVLFGDGLRVLLDWQRWPAYRSFRFWVLNEEHRQMIQRAFPGSTGHVGVIPRRDLLKKAPKQSRFPSLKEPMNFVFSGRPLPEKNLTLICTVVQELQRAGIDARLHIFGPAFPGEYTKFLPDEGWIQKPYLHGNKGEKWFNQISMNPIYVGMGLELTDDFCVSCAQAEEAGWPVIVPDRGPYKEISTRYFVCLPQKLIRDGDPILIARHILENSQSQKRNETPARAFTIPEPLSTARLEEVFLKETKYVSLIKRTFIEGMASESHERLSTLLEDR